MAPLTRVALISLASAGIGAFAAKAIYAQTSPASPVYVIAEIDVTDKNGFADYSNQSGKLIESFGGRFLARGGKTETAAGGPAPARAAIIVFDSFDKAEAYRQSPQYMALVALRDKSSKFRAFTVEGCSECRPLSAN